LAPQLVVSTWERARSSLLAIPLDSALKIPIAVKRRVEEVFGLDLGDELSNEAAKGLPAELIEIPVSAAGSPVERLLILGIGDGSVADYRKAGITLGRRLKGRNAHVTNAVTFSANKEALIAHNVSLALATYAWSKRALVDAVKPVKEVELILRSGDGSPAVTRAQIEIDSVFAARDLIHTPANIKSPAWLAAMAHEMATAAGDPALSVRVREERELRDEGFGGLLAVGMSSPKRAPRLVEITYAPAGSKSWPHVVLVGKGIVFDTGGISLKRPYDVMVPMKTDMAGAAAVMAACIAMSRIRPRARVTALLGCAENAISATAQRPSDVITHYGGTTVEVINTDAEGRLVLADLLAYADSELDPDYLVDVATLTGAASLGLGRQNAALYTRDEKLAKSFVKYGSQSGDLTWHMPLVDDYDFVLESDIADYNHTGSKGKVLAGSITAALFLEKFVGNRRWVHLDIAGPARSDSDSGENVKGGTGFGVRLLIEWLASL